eukprot:gnl/Dysnectes_brevis/2883_a3521_1245.p1 GENE.gnl/Dysnectes_brevis/2883_a3521_1245~~gnl/Dysnectes_brevis/2883_a3521_1245.p1  ORF type:complete len:912 (+),score=227.66 gnl/Dysnectes_brevis/2883_a3521_1245:145-2880(+)
MEKDTTHIGNSMQVAFPRHKRDATKEGEIDSRAPRPRYVNTHRKPEARSRDEQLTQTRTNPIRPTSRDIKRVNPSGQYGTDTEEFHYNPAHHEMLNSRYQVHTLLGHGTFGKVFACTDTKTGREVAVKIIRSIDKYTYAGRSEVELLKKIRDRVPKSMRGIDCLLELLDDFEWRGHVCLVCPRYGHSLLDLLRANRFRGFNLDWTRELSRSFLEGVHCLHSLRLIHTDLKPENVMSKQKPIATRVRDRIFVHPPGAEMVVIDVGSVICWDEARPSLVCTRQYRPPEVILSNEWGPSIDIWSCGCLAEGTEVLMADGAAAKVERLVVGQKLLGPDGGSRTITQLVTALEPLYDIITTSSRRCETVGVDSSPFEDLTSVTGNHTIVLVHNKMCTDMHVEGHWCERVWNDDLKAMETVLRSCDTHPAPTTIQEAHSYVEMTVKEYLAFCSSEHPTTTSDGSSLFYMAANRAPLQGASSVIVQLPSGVEFALTEAVCWLLGYWIASGGADCEGMCCLTTATAVDNQHILQFWTETGLDSIFGDLSVMSTTGGVCFAVSSQWTELINTLGLENKSLSVDTPNALGSAANRFSFLAGMLDNSGGVVRHDSGFTSLSVVLTGLGNGSSLNDDGLKRMSTLIGTDFNTTKSGECSFFHNNDSLLSVIRRSVLKRGAQHDPSSDRRSLSCFRKPITAEEHQRINSTKGSSAAAICHLGRPFFIAGTPSPPRRYYAVELDALTDRQHVLANGTVQHNCILYELFFGRTLFRTHSSPVHLAMMERICGPMPRHLLNPQRCKYARHFQRGKWVMPTEVPAGEKRHYQECRPLLEEVRPESVTLYDLLRRMLMWDWRRRPSAAECLEHPFFWEEPKESRAVQVDPVMVEEPANYRHLIQRLLLHVPPSVRTQYEEELRALDSRK